MHVSRWRRWQWNRQAKQQSKEEITVHLVWPDTNQPPSRMKVGDTFTVADVFTLVVTGDRQIRISPPMTDVQMAAMTEAEIRARYGLAPHGVNT